ncbi:MAG: hypothetical protein D6741_09370 [Planctomycetota bacterium]|nr:MAG: hypothetical protein D6741_09370 [Planctomycetota bacterium]
MSLSADTAAKIVEACREGAEEIAGALSRALDAECTSVAPGDPGVFSPDDATFSGTALVVALLVDNAAALVVVPQASGLLPSWAANPDPTGESKLATLGQELGLLVLPPDLMATDFKSVYVEDLREAIQKAGVVDGAGLVPLVAQVGGNEATLYVLVPANTPSNLWGKAPETPAAAAAPAPSKPQAAPATTGRQRRVRSVRDLPLFTQSLLRVKVPVMVTLAEVRQPLSQILQLAPGAILQFSKSCEEPLDLQVGNRTIARGEAVKVGDKFGLRIQEIVLPEERFVSLRPRKKTTATITPARR